MRDYIGIKSQSLNRLARFAVVRCGRGIGEKEFSLAFGRISFHWNDDCGANENPFLPLLRKNDASLFDPKALAQACRNNDGASLPYFGGFHGHLQMSDYVIA